MGSSLYHFAFMHLSHLLSLFLVIVAYSSASVQPLCHVDENYALLQFKESFIIDKSASRDPSAYPKVASWKPERKSGDCCSWDGIECDEDTGHVISLNLTSSCLYGSINSSSSLFRLVHLEWLSLMDNNFNYSRIPSGFGNLSRLSHLDISFSVFSGEFPTRNFQLPNLQFLNVRFNPLTGYLPDSIGNLWSLNVLAIGNCYFSGPIPSSIGNLTELSHLDLLSNNFSGQIPSSLGNLTKLSVLDVYSNNFSGQIPSLLANLTQLTFLDLSFNNFNRGTLSWLGKLTKLKQLYLEGINLYSDIPSSLSNLTQLTQLSFFANQLTGKIPTWLGNLTQLTNLNLAQNKLHGLIPQSISRLLSLEILSLYSNYLSGEAKVDLFLNLRNLTSLQLSSNNLSVITSPSVNATIPKLEILGLSSCNLLEFPDFLRDQDELEHLTLSENKIDGQIPKWFWNLSNETLVYLALHSNSLTGFDQPPVVLPWTSLRVLNLASNKLQGSLPIPPPSIFSYDVSENSLTGEISPMICNLTSLKVLDMSNNYLSGMLPPCLGNSSETLMVLSLRNNHFHGTIPHTFMKGCNLRMIDFSQNHLEGKVSMSLANCTMLEILDLANNQINDFFPSWLGTLPELRVLILRSNGFYGTIGNPETNIEFPKLHILDLSFNSFTGKLPSQHFQMWNAMKFFDADHMRYLEANTSFELPQYSNLLYFDFSMTITNKGTKTYYEKIQEFLVAIDFSSNKFEGHIPGDIGNLRALHLLNLSNNILTGHIPSSFENLTELESLDLSQNKLTGEIPQQLSQLTFLAFLNVSHNRLTGPIPQGKQFNTFENNSFEDNPGLCGNPLSKKCGVSPPPPSSTAEEDKGSSSPFEFDWKVVVIGHACGLVVGVFIGHTVITRKPEWFAMTFVMRQQKMRRVQRRGREN